VHVRCYRDAGSWDSTSARRAPTPSQLGPVPAGFDAWFARAVARDQSARFQSIREAAEQLERACGNSGARASLGSASTDPFDPTLAVADTIAARSVGAVSIQTTSGPSSRSIHGLTTQKRRSRSVVIASLLAAVVVGGFYAGWRMLHAPDAAQATASSGVSAEPTPMKPEVAPQPSPAQLAAPQPSPVQALPSTPPSAPGATTSIASVTPPAAPVVAAPAIRQGKPKNAPAPDPAKPGASERAPSPLPPANVTAPRHAPAAPNDRLGI
jgi:serine/threonine-protein kinase